MARAAPAPAVQMSREAASLAASPSVGPESPALHLEDLDYQLPPELIAQHPVEPRDASRLLVHRRATGVIEDRIFRELPEVLGSGDVLVRNDTRVFAARSFFRRATGGRIEALFLRPAAGRGPDTWEALLRGRPRRAEALESERLGADWQIRCDEPLGDGRWLVASLGRRPVLELLGEAGVTPLPPYIREPLADAERYQTSYARATGSAAAPTAGLHFTPELDEELRAAGVQIEALTLHVGLGTFKPLAAETLREGRLHGEMYEVQAGTWARLLAARAEGRRVLTVGTTSMRTLEHLARVHPAPPGAAAGVSAPAAEGAATPAALRGETSLFISPGFEVRLVDGLLTNFHLPRTSLLALVMAVCGVDATRRLYRHAVDERYRFYSFGDAMLVL